MLKVCDVENLPRSHGRPETVEFGSYGFFLHFKGWCAWEPDISWPLGLRGCFLRLQDRVTRKKQKTLQKLMGSLGFRKGALNPERSF